MKYYDATDLFEIAKVTGKKIYVNINKALNGFLDEIDSKKLYGYIFAELFIDDDTDGYCAEPVYWDTVFDRDDDGYYNVVCTEVYGDWGVDHYEYTRDEDAEDTFEENVDWTADLIEELIA